MMFGKVATSFAPKMMNSRRGLSSFAGALSKNVWRKSNVTYIAYVVVACVGVEIVYGGVTDWAWDKYNSGVSN